MSGIVRVKKYKPGEFWQSLKAPFQDKLLSFGARGILAYLLTHPDGWEVRNKDLYDKSPAGRAAVDRMMIELKEHGYLHRVRESHGKGIIEWVTEIYENRAENPDYSGFQGDDSDSYTKADFTNVVKPAFEEPDTKADFTKADFTNVVKPGDIVIMTPDNKRTPTGTSTVTPERCVAEGVKCLRMYEREIGALSPLLGEAIGAYIDEINELLAAKQNGETTLGWFKYALLEACSCDARNWKFIKAILENIISAGSLAAHKANYKEMKSEHKNRERKTNGKAGAGQKGQAATLEEYLQQKADAAPTPLGNF